MLPIREDLQTEFIYMKDIGWNGEEFTDEEERPIKKSVLNCIHGEWLIREEFGEHIHAEKNDINWIEPAWKMILSNKVSCPLCIVFSPIVPIY